MMRNSLIIVMLVMTIGAAGAGEFKGEVASGEKENRCFADNAGSIANYAGGK